MYFIITNVVQITTMLFFSELLCYSTLILSLYGRVKTRGTHRIDWVDQRASLGVTENG